MRNIAVKNFACWSNKGKPELIIQHSNLLFWYNSIFPDQLSKKSISINQTLTFKSNHDRILLLWKCYLSYEDFAVTDQIKACF